MAYAALVAWVLAAGAGVYLLIAWMAEGGLRSQAIKVTRFPAVVVLGHPLSALAGLAAWIAHIATARAVYAWSAFAALAVSTMLGFVMFTRWLAGEGGRHARGAERELPGPAVLVHGLVAVVTFVLVFLTAIVAGRS